MSERDDTCPDESVAKTETVVVPSFGAANVKEAEHDVLRPQSKELDSGCMESASEDSHEIDLIPTSSSAVALMTKGWLRSGLDGRAELEETRGSASYWWATGPSFG